MASPIIVDLHAHYPMHVLDPGLGDLHRLMTTICRGSLRRRVEAAILWLADLLANYRRNDVPAVTAQSLAASQVRVALSMLLVPACEIDIDEPYNAPPEPGYYDELIRLIKKVEEEVSQQSTTPPIYIARHYAELAPALSGARVALVHAVEGGLYLGTTPAEVSAHVEELRHVYGVAYITLAHLFYRGFATNSPGVPFLSDQLYARLFPQEDIGLSDLGRAAVEAMMLNHVIVDLSHMSGLAIEETLDLMDQRDPAPHAVPVISGHCGCRAFRQGTYNVSDANVVRIARRRGVVGLMACQHWMQRDGRTPGTFDDTMELICAHSDHIHDVLVQSGVPDDYDHVAFGSDMDGFIKPTLPGLEGPGGFTAVRQRLASHYNASVAEKICSANALRVLLEGWG